MVGVSASKGSEPSEQQAHLQPRQTYRCFLWPRSAEARCSPQEQTRAGRTAQGVRLQTEMTSWVLPISLFLEPVKHIVFSFKFSYITFCTKCQHLNNLFMRL